MSFVETIFISISLAMDAFAVSICKGLSMKKMNWKSAIIIGLYFGFFQMFMPMIGFILGVGFSDLVVKIDHWIAFFLLVTIGVKMIKEAFDSEDVVNDKTDVNTMIVLAIATSIDALAVGITYAFLEVKNIWMSFAFIGIITFVLSIIGVKIGNKFGDKLGKKAEILGGLMLIIIGIKILIEHIF